MYTSRRLAVAVTALGTVAAGLVSGATVNSADASAAAAGQSVDVLVKRDHTIQMPTTIQPGVTTFKITSTRLAGFQIAQTTKGYTKKAAMRDVTAAFTKNNMRALKRFESKVTLLGGMPSTPKQAATMSTRLREGTYWALDTAPMRLDPSKILTFKVAGAPVGGQLSGHVIRAVGEVDWGRLSQHIPTQGQIWFQNRSKDNHFLEIAKLAKGKTMKDFRRWIEDAKAGKQSPPPVNLAHTVDTGVISPGKSMSLSYRLPAGRYVLLCWWSDADMGGTPHAFMGMYRGLTVG
jgi:hypothetical protein